jgi:hypothetical protein
MVKNWRIRELGAQLAIIAFGFVILAGVVLVFVPNLLPGKDPIPANVTGDLRIAYAFSRTEEGNDLLEQMPCYCGCKYVGHMHTRDCFWTDEGKWDKHGVRCMICVEIAMNTKLMHVDGKDVCEIRVKIDSHYERVAEHATETPIPEGCEG